LIIEVHHPCPRNGGIRIDSGKQPAEVDTAFDPFTGRAMGCGKTVFQDARSHSFTPGLHKNAESKSDPLKKLSENSSFPDRHFPITSQRLVGNQSNWKSTPRATTGDSDDKEQQWRLTCF
jgi:hypothetical protein